MNVTGAEDSSIIHRNLVSSSHMRFDYGGFFPTTNDKLF